MKRRWVLPAMLVFSAQKVFAENEVETQGNGPKRTGQECKWQRSGPACGASVTQYGSPCGIRNDNNCGTRVGNNCRPQNGNHC